MGKCQRVLRCYHCGSVLQTKDPKQKGYISVEQVGGDLTTNRILYCDRCFDVIRSFNNSALDLQIDQDILRILDDAVATDALIIWVIDLFAFNGALNPEIAKKIKKLKVVVVGNKVDLMPRGKEKGIEEYINERFKEFGIKPHAVRLLGNSNKIDMAGLLADMNKARQGHDVYLIGNALSGKTTLINRMLKVYENKTKREIRSITYGDTNVKVLEIPLSKSSFLYELPGFSQNTSVLNKVEKDVKNFILPKRQLKVTLKTLLPKDAFIIGSLASFALIEGKATIFKFYSAEGVETKKVNVKNVEAAFAENYEKKNVRPVSNRYATFLDYDVFDYLMEKDGKYHDIAIEGLGWVQFKAVGQTIRVVAPKGASIKESLSRIR